METRFVPDAPGAWLVYDLGALVFALPPEFRAAGDAVAAAVVPGAGVSPVLAALTATGIADAAPFAVLDATDGDLAVALRGPATVSVGPDTVTGLGVAPWLERVFPEGSVARLTVPGGEWTFTLAATVPAVPVPPTVVAPPLASTPPAPPAPLFDESNDITEIPDLELSAPPPPALSPVADAIGEHDGGTVLVSDLPARPAEPAAAETPAAEAPAAEDKTVVVDEIAQLRARRSGGLAPPAAPVTAAPVAQTVPTMSLELPDGSREPLDAVVLIGRAPSAPADGSRSRLVRLEGDGDISRNHARVALEGGTVVVTDLGSRNGTIVRIPGRPPQKLREGEPTPVLVGTVIDFGGGVELSVREA